MADQDCFPCGGKGFVWVSDTPNGPKYTIVCSDCKGSGKR